MNAQHIVENLKQRFPNEPEYIQAVSQVLPTIEEEYNKHPEFERANLIERLCIPDRVIEFRVSWVDDTAGQSIQLVRLCAIDGDGVFLYRLIHRIGAEHHAAFAAARKGIQTPGVERAAVRGGMYARDKAVRIRGVGCIHHGKHRRDTERVAAHPGIGIHAALTGARKQYGRIRIRNIIEIDADIFRIPDFTPGALIAVHIQKNGKARAAKKQGERGAFAAGKNSGIVPGAAPRGSDGRCGNKLSRFAAQTEDRKILIRKRIDVFAVHTENVALREIAERCGAARRGGCFGCFRRTRFFLYGGKDAAVVRKRSQLRPVGFRRGLEGDWRGRRRRRGRRGRRFGCGNLRLPGKRAARQNGRHEKNRANYKDFFEISHNNS